MNSESTKDYFLEITEIQKTERYIQIETNILVWFESRDMSILC
jgi:hypothetical protein